MKIFLEIFFLTLSTGYLIKNILVLAKGVYSVRQTILYVYPLIYILYSMPVAIRLFVGGYEYTKFPISNSAFNDSMAYGIYLVFMSVFIVSLWKTCYKKIKMNNLRDLVNYADKFIIQNPKILRNIEFFLMSLNILPIAAFFMNFHNSVALLINGFGSQYTANLDSFSRMGFQRLSIYSFFLHLTVIRKINSKIIIHFFLMLFFIYLDGKRGGIILLVIFSVYALCMTKKIRPSTMLNIGFFLAPSVIGLSYLYTFFVKPMTGGFLQFLLVDLGRDYSFVGAIYAELNNTDILSYRGESIVFTLLFWVPRNLWVNKPIPFDTPITNYLLGRSNHYADIDWGITASVFCEFVANFSYFGLPLSAAFIILLVKLADRVKLAVTQLLLIFFIYFCLDLYLSSAVQAVTILTIAISAGIFISRNKSVKVDFRESVKS